MIRVLPVLIATFTLAACALDIAGPQVDLDGLPAGLEVLFWLEPAEVRQHEAFSVHLHVTNTTTETIQVVTSHGCLVVPGVIRDGKQVPFAGSTWGCTAAITTHSFAPGETRVRTWDMRAELYAQHPGDVEGAPAPKGSYFVQAEFDVHPDSGFSRKPVTQRTLRVR